MKKRKKENGNGGFDSGKIVVHFGNQVYEGNFIRDVRIHESRINEMLTEQPGKFAFWADLAAKQQYIYEKMKSDLEIFEAQLSRRHRIRMERENSRVTDATVMAAIKRDPERITKMEALLLAKYHSERLSAIKYAFVQRKDMLMSLGANLREEMGETVMRIREKQFLTERLERTAKGKASK